MKKNKNKYVNMKDIDELYQYGYFGEDWEESKDLYYTIELTSMSLFGHIKYNIRLWWLTRIVSRIIFKLGIDKFIKDKESKYNE